MSGSVLVDLTLARGSRRREGVGERVEPRIHARRPWIIVGVHFRRSGGSRARVRYRRPREGSSMARERVSGWARWTQMDAHSGTTCRWNNQCILRSSEHATCENTHGSLPNNSKLSIPTHERQSTFVVKEVETAGLKVEIFTMKSVYLWREGPLCGLGTHSACASSLMVCLAAGRVQLLCRRLTDIHMT